MNRLILLKGMNPRADVFSKLAPLLPNAEVVEWLPPEGDESIGEYAERLCDRMNLDESCDVLGVSFGGLVAQEMALHRGVRFCFVVSSAGSAREFPGYRRVLRWGPQRARRTLFENAGALSLLSGGRGSSSSMAGVRRLSGPDGSWYRWAMSAAVDWEPSSELPQRRIIRIHGDRDRTFPRGHLSADHVIAGGGHLLAVTHAKEVADIVGRYRAEADTGRWKTL